MIPHHHHDMQDSSSNDHFKTEDSHNHETEEHKHHQEEKDEDNHNHSFPFHNHTVAADDYSFTRSNNSNVSQNIQKKIVVLFFETFLFDNIDPPNQSINYFVKEPNFITSLFEPGANALRAPPAIV